MNKQKQTVMILLAAMGFCASSFAEVGVGAGLSFNAKAKFRSSGASLAPVNDPGAAVGGVDHEYDDGFNRVDITGNWDRGTGVDQTWNWGYENASQYDAVLGTITMNNTYDSAVLAGSTTVEDNDPQLSFELYWKEDLYTTDDWGFGLRAALRYQRIDIEDKGVGYEVNSTTVSDSYSLNGVIPPSSPYVGTYQGPSATIGDLPTRTSSSVVSASNDGLRSIKGDLWAIDLGPTVTYAITEQIGVMGYIAGTMAWTDSKLSYRDGDLASGSGGNSEFLFGGTAGLDLQLMGEDYLGFFVGVAYSSLQNLDLKADYYQGSLGFENNVLLRMGFFFR